MMNVLNKNGKVDNINRKEISSEQWKSFLKGAKWKK